MATFDFQYFVEIVLDHHFESLFWRETHITARLSMGSSTLSVLRVLFFPEVDSHDNDSTPERRFLSGDLLDLMRLW